MQIELRVDGEAVITMEISPKLLSELITWKVPVTNTEPVAKSTPLTKAQVEELLSRVDAKSVHFLKRIAANNGSITWGEMKEIFGIDNDWTAFSSSYGRGITRALRHILDDKSARLIWWIDAEWECLKESEQDRYKVYIDGAALRALREILGLGA